MFREAEALPLGPLAGPHFISPATQDAPVAPARPVTAEVETIEQEINRLTWAVLDGNASLADRQRLAELVNRQHILRRRVAR